MALSAAQAVERSTLSAAWHRLHRAEPRVTWDLRTARSVDVTCDGKADTIVVGQGGHRLWVGVVASSRMSRGRAAVFDFAVSSGVQEAVCSLPVRIVVSKPSCLQEGEEPLPGCKPTRGCMQFSIDSGNCDPLYFYWNGDRRELDWWRP